MHTNFKLPFAISGHGLQAAFVMLRKRQVLYLAIYDPHMAIYGMAISLCHAARAYDHGQNVEKALIHVKMSIRKKV